VTENEDDEKVVEIKEKLEQTELLQTLEKISFQAAQTKDPGFQKFIHRHQEIRYSMKNAFIAIS
jgi:hypothetical protein